MNWFKRLFTFRSAASPTTPQNTPNSGLLKLLDLSVAGDWSDDVARMHFVKVVVMAGAGAGDAGVWAYHPEAIPADSKFKKYGVSLEHAIEYYNKRAVQVILSSESQCSTECQYFSRMQTQTRNDLCAVRCPIHGAPPTRVTIYGTSPATASFYIEGCCEEVVRHSFKKLGVSVPSTGPVYELVELLLENAATGDQLRLLADGLEAWAKQFGGVFLLEDALASLRSNHPMNSRISFKVNADPGRVLKSIYNKIPFAAIDKVLFNGQHLG